MAEFIVGLTGGIGSGKTTVSNMFADLGIEIIDADVIARKVVSPNSPALSQIVEHFGQNILLENGELNRALLRSKIFSNDNEKVWLNALLHPLIRESIIQALSSASGDYCILSAPLLFENDLQLITHKTLVIDVTIDTQIQRTTIRDSSNSDEVKAIIASQLPRDKRIKLADDVINNESHELSKLKTQVAMLDNHYKKIANASKSI